MHERIHKAHFRSATLVRKGYRSKERPSHKRPRENGLFWSVIPGVLQRGPQESRLISESVVRIVIQDDRDHIRTETWSRILLHVLPGDLFGLIGAREEL